MIELVWSIVSLVAFVGLFVLRVTGKIGTTLYFGILTGVMAVNACVAARYDPMWSIVTSFLVFAGFAFFWQKSIWIDKDKKGAENEPGTS